MRYQLTPIPTRPWLLNGLSLRLIESHYENHYGGALRRVEEVKARLDASQPVQIIDARPRSYMSRQGDIMDGAVWRDPERINQWIGELSKSDPVVVFCAYGFHVGCKTAVALRDAGFDAKYMKGGHSAWKAIGGPIKLNT
jgi:superoxide dismutase, Fe-Mn family